MPALRRLPIRLRLAAACAAAIALVLVAAAAFVYLRMRVELDATVTQGIRSRAGDVVALIRKSNQGLEASERSPLYDREESFAQILTPRGAIVDSTSQVRAHALLTGRALREALHGTQLLDRPSVAGFEGPTRLLVTSVRTDDRRLVAVVGASLDDRDEALRTLLFQFALGSPVALLLASLIGYGVAAAALRPVESMRREAAEVSVTQPGRRLPVPPVRDEIGRLGDTLNEMLARQEAAFARERTFVSDASHELRTPLANLRTEVELALRNGRSARELEAALRSVGEEADRLTQLAEDLLVLARSDHGGLPVGADDVAAVELLETTRTRYAQRAAGARRTIRIEADDGLRLVADRLRVQQALGNLVENAMRHGDGEVVLSAERADGGVELHVRDAGPGFPAGFLPSAFERFTRSDRARSGGGSGLGLAIVAAIAAAHGGAAAAGNRPEGGADVVIRLPTRDGDGLIPRS